MFLSRVSIMNSQRGVTSDTIIFLLFLSNYMIFIQDLRNR